MIGGEVLGAHVFEQRVVHDLDEPDQTDEAPGGDRMDDEPRDHPWIVGLPLRHASLQ